jgi:gentisate 1,2-dioxygenase
MAADQQIPNDGFDDELKVESMEGHWIAGSDEEEKQTYCMDPYTTVLPHVWKWEVIHRHLTRAGEIRDLAGMADRRTLRLIKQLRRLSFRGGRRRCVHRGRWREILHGSR